MYCPICNSKALSVFSLKKEFLFKELKDYFGDELPLECKLLDYEIMRCTKCTLEYSSPLEAGSNLFYQWITSRKGYYPKSRWEWFAVTEEIEKRKKTNSASILDVGCGGGNFLEIARKIPSLRLFGLDTTPESIKQCRDKGFDAYCQTIESFQDSYPGDKFDFLVSFHCLEHISNPKSFVKSMLTLLKPEGSIFISTPYSPMSFESDWFDILNHPPHHLLRWNKKAYDELAFQLGCQVKYYMPPARSVLGRTTNTFHLSKLGKNQPTSKLNLLTTAIKNPLILSRIFFHQLMRKKVNGKTAADVILVELSFANN
ncbi:MAG: class I SAM-dependent methyltransferase [Rivularia sp. (in: cyanobacteria)]